MSEFIYYITRTKYEQLCQKPNELRLYLHLQRMVYKGRGYTYISPDSVYYNFYGTNQKKIKPIIRQGVDYLIDNGIILGEKISDDYYQIAESSFDFKGEYFISIPESYIDLILNSSHRSKEDLINYLCFIIGSINKKTGIGHTSMSVIAEKLNKPRRTLSRYSSVLQELKIIYVEQPNAQGGNFNINRYSLYKDRDKI